MNTTATRRAVGEPQVLESYESREGLRQLVAQRVKGRVALSDIPASDRGRVYLIARHVGGNDELKALVADYASLARQLGRAPLERDWIFDNHKHEAP